MKQNHTEIVFVVDRSGSMAGIAKAMQEGYEKLIEDQRKVVGTCDVTLAQFDDKYESVFERVPVERASRLVIEPRGMTALYDAIGRTIDSVGARLKRTPEDERPSKVVFVVITDGYENSSKEFRRADVSKRIEHQKTKYSWDFVFLGGTLDAVDVALSIGIQNAASFQTTASGSDALYRSISHAIGSTRTTGAALNYDQCTYNASLNTDGKTS